MPYLRGVEIELYSDEYFMKEALKEASKALAMDEVPVGAVVVCRNRIIGRGHNLTETLHDVTAHAEMQAITAASDFLGAKYLNECTLYVSLEPCTMCAGAIYWAQFQRLVFAASDPKRGYQVHGKLLLHPKTSVETGLLGAEAGKMMTDFFAARRNS